jgi:hypothetical protein
MELWLLVKCYGYKGKYFSLDEVDLEEFDNPKDAFDRASIGRERLFF